MSKPYEGWTQEQIDKHKELLQETDFEKVGEFREKFNLPVSDEGCELPDTATLIFMLGHLQEELTEMTKAIGHRDPIEIADATVDLVYVALGMAHVCNMPWKELFNEVHRTNMLKERATNPNQSKRGSTLDVIKPVFWQPPDIKGIVEKHFMAGHDD